MSYDEEPKLLEDQRKLREEDNTVRKHEEGLVMKLEVQFEVR